MHPNSLKVSAFVAVLFLLLISVQGATALSLSGQRPFSSEDPNQGNNNNNNAWIHQCRGGAIATQNANNKKRRSQTTMPQPAQQAISFARELAESAAYASVYAILALLFAGWVDVLFPAFDAAQSYTIPTLLVQVVGQAGVNAAAAQATRRFVQKLPGINKIDGKADKSVPAAGGSVIFGFLMFTRQSNWKAKVLALDALLDKTWFFP